MRFGSLFTGVGGFDLGFERSGLSGVWQVENNADCIRVLESRFPNVSRYGKVEDVGKLPTVDVICGGFPCQDLSVAGKRAGLAGKRSGLWFEFLRIITSNLPRWIVIENVPGLLSSDEGRDFAVILRGLVECGYCLAWRIVDAQYDGVAQRRRRVFIVGSLGDGSCAEILFESESVPWNPPTRREAGQGVTPILEAGARTNGDGNRDGDGIGVEGDPMFTLQRGKQHAVAANNFGERDVSIALSSKNERLDGDTETFVVTATLKQRGRGACDEVMDNLQVSMPLKGKANSSHDESHETYVAAPITSSFAKHHGRTAGSNGGADNLIVQDLEHHRFHCLTCGQWFGVNDYESNTVTCPKCGETRIDKITDVLDVQAVDVRNLRMQPDGRSGTLQHKKSGGYSLNYQNPILAFSSKDHGADAGQIAPTLRAQNPKDSHQNGGGQVAIAWALHSQNSCAMTGDGDAQAAFEVDKVRALDGGAGFTAGQGGNLLQQNAGPTFGVRRLTPRECERLQGFPDDWTLYDSHGKEISDSARYRMLGNAVAVPVSKWIGGRIVKIANR